MSRFQQRLRKHLQNPEVAAGYWEMDSQIRLVEALDLIRERFDLSTEELARRSGRARAIISRLFTAKRANPTLDTFSDLLKVMHVTAEIRFRLAQADEPAIRVDMDTLQAEVGRPVVTSENEKTLTRPFSAGAAPRRRG